MLPKATAVLGLSRFSGSGVAAAAAPQRARRPARTGAAAGAAARARAAEEGPARGGAGGALRPTATARERPGKAPCEIAFRTDVDHQVRAAAGVRFKTAEEL